MCNVLPQARFYICLSDDSIWTWPPSRQFRCTASVTVAIEPGTSRATFVTPALGKTCLHNPLISLCSASLECGTDSGNIPEACLLLSAWDSQQFLDWSWLKTAPPTARGHRTPLNWASATRVLQENSPKMKNCNTSLLAFPAKVWTCICILIFGGFYPTLIITFKTLVWIYVHLFKKKREKKKKKWVH